MATPPTFTLNGDTGGGPPVEYTWTRNGAVIINNGSYNVSIGLNHDAAQYTSDVDILSHALYRSTLIVTGVLPGVYQYSVNNEATHSSVNRRFNTEGSCFIYQYHYYTSVLLSG